MSYRELRHGKIVTTKTKFCDWCGEEISANSECSRVMYLLYGDLTIDYYHIECHNAMEGANIGVDGWHPGDFKRGSTEEA